jgi:hypothetical protein
VLKKRPLPESKFDQTRMNTQLAIESATIQSLTFRELPDPGLAGALVCSDGCTVVSGVFN